MKKFKPMGEWLIEQQHRHDDVGAIARSMAALGADRVAPLFRDDLRELAVTHGLVPAQEWSVLDEVFHSEWIDQAGYCARIGTVYIVSAGGLYKIGVTKNTKKRMGNLQIGSPSRLTLVHSFSVVGMYGDAWGWEKMLHSRFENKRRHGEWFALSNDDVQWIKQITGYFVNWREFETEYRDAWEDVDEFLNRYKAHCEEEERFAEQWRGYIVNVSDASGEVVTGRCYDTQWGCGLIVKLFGMFYWVDVERCSIVAGTLRTTIRLGDIGGVATWVDLAWHRKHNQRTLRGKPR